MNRICAERKLLGMTQEQLSKTLGVDVSTVVRWEKGGDISQKYVARLRGLFGCDIDWLLCLSDERRTVDLLSNHTPDSSKVQR